MGTLFASLYRALRRRRRLVALATVLIVVVAAIGATRLRTTEDLAHVLPDRDPAVEDLRVLDEAFGGTHRLLLDLRWTGAGEPEGLREFGDRLEGEFGALRQVTSVVYRFDRPEWWETLSDLPGLLPLLATREDLDEMPPRLEPEAIREALEATFERFTDFEGVALRKTLRIDPLGLARDIWGRLGSLQPALRVQMTGARLASEDGRSLLMIVTVESSAVDTREARRLLSDVEDAITAAEPGPDIRVHQVSAHRSTQDNYASVRRGTQGALSVTAVSLAFIFVLCFRRWWLGLAVFLPTAMALLIVVGVLGYGGRVWSLIPLGYAAAVVGLTVDYAVHLAYRHDRGTEGAGAVLQKLARPVLLSGLTTAGAFFCLWLGSIPAQRMVGSFAGFSVLIAVVLALVLLPHLLPEHRGRRRRPAWLRPEGFFRGVISFTARRSVLVSLVGWGLLAFLMVGLPRLRFEGDPNRLSALSPTTRADERAFTEHFGSPDAEMVLAATGADREEALQAAEALTRHLQELLRTGFVRSLSSPSPLLPSVARRGENLAAWRAFFTPDRITAITTHLDEIGREIGFHPEFFRPFLSLLESPPAPERAESLFALAEERIRTHAGRTLVLVTARPGAGVSSTALEDSIRDAVPGVRVSSRHGIAERLMTVVREDTIVVTLVAVLIVVAILLAACPLTPLALIPVTGGLLASLGFLGWVDQPLNIVNVMVVAFLFGTGIDYGVFTVQAWGQDRLPASERLAPTLTAISLSAGTTLCGFVALAFCEHPALSSVGQVAALGITVTFFCTLFLVPPLLEIFLPSARHQRPLTLFDLVRTLALYLHFFAMASLRLTVVAPARWFWLGRGRPLMDRLDALVQRSLVHLHPGRTLTDPFPLERPCVLVANHQSLTDMFILLSVLPRASICTKTWVARLPIVGRAARAMGHIFYEQADLQTLTGRVRERLDEGRVVVFFAEGGRSRDGRIRRLRLGAFHLAARLKVPVVPAVFSGTIQVSPKGTIWMRHYPSSLRFLPPQEAPATDEPGAIRAWSRSCRESMVEAAETEAFRLLSSDEGPRAIARHYLHQSPLYRHYARSKLHRDPWPVRLAAELPPRGAILDVGCGQGLSAVALTAWSPDRTVVGVDTNAGKIRSARSACPYEGARFVEADIVDPRAAGEIGGPFVGALVIDVLHYWPRERQAAILSRVGELLEPHGQLRLRDIVRDADHFAETARSERIAKAIGWNHPSDGDHVHLTRAEMRDLLEEAGFEILAERDDVPAGTANVVFDCRRVRDPAR